MALAPIQLLGSNRDDGIGRILSQGVNVLQSALQNAIESGRRDADNQLRQEGDFLSERRDLRLMSERKGNELQRRFESTRAFDESVTRDRRDFSRGVLESDRSFGQNVLQQERSFGLALGNQALRGQELMMRGEENAANSKYRADVLAAKSDDNLPEGPSFGEFIESDPAYIAGPDLLPAKPGEIIPSDIGAEEPVMTAQEPPRGILDGGIPGMYDRAKSYLFPEEPKSALQKQSDALRGLDDFTLSQLNKQAIAMNPKNFMAPEILATGRELDRRAKIEAARVANEKQAERERRAAQQQQGGRRSILGGSSSGGRTLNFNAQ